MYIVFDIGGSHMRVARSLDGKELSDVIVERTPADFNEGVRVLKDLFIKISGNEKEKIEAVAGGIAGIANPADATLFSSVNLHGWEGHSLSQALAEYPHVYVGNDAAFAALGEAVHGAGVGAGIVAYYTVSTGIGGARVVDRKIDRYTVGFEPGKQIINHEDFASVESYISGHNIESHYHKQPRTITDSSLWKNAARDLAIAAFNSILHWSPDIFVFGGPMILHNPGIDIADVRNELEKLTAIFPVRPEIRLATLGDESGLYGALEYIREQLTLS